MEKSEWSEFLSFFNRSMELRYGLHMSCVGLWADIVLSWYFGKSFWIVTDREWMGIPYGLVFVWLLEYFVIMGLAFPVLYAIFTIAISRISPMGPSRGDWEAVPGMIHQTGILKFCHATKDYEPLRALERHQQQCKRSRKTGRELAVLSFAAIVLLSVSWCFGWGFMARYVIEFLQARFVEAVLFVALLMLLPFVFIIVMDLLDNGVRDEFLDYPPLLGE